MWSGERIASDHGEQPTWIFDIERLTMVWANRSALLLWGAPTLAVLLERDFTDVSTATRTRLDGYLREFAAGRRVREQWTLYPEGVARTVLCACAGVPLPDQRLGMLVECTFVAEASPDDLRGVEALRHTSVNITLFDREGAVLMQNPAAARSFGAPRPEGNEFIRRVHRRSEGEDLFRRAVAGEVVALRLLVDTEGGVRWHALDARITPDPATGAPAVLAHQRDVTTEEDALVALRASEQRFRTLCTHAPIGIFELTPSGHIAYVNAHLASMFGMAAEALVSERLEVLVHPDDRERAAVTIGGLLSGQGAPSFRWRCLVGERVRWITGSASPVFDREGRAASYVGTLLDVTEMVVNAERFRALHDGSQDAHVLFEGRRIVDANAAALRLFKRRRVAELPGAQLYREWSLDAAVGHADADANAGRVFEWHYTRPDGQEVTCEVTATPLLSRGVHGAVVVLRDVTERKRAQMAIINSREAALEASRVKSRFLANMSHEIRTPMNGVLGMLRLAGETPLTEEQEEYVTTALASAENLLEIINGILDLSKIEERKMRVERVPVELARVVHEACKSVALRAHERGLALIEDVADDVPRWFLGDPMRLRQVLINLLGNAIKFTERGRVVARARLASPASSVPILLLSVVDSGPGIPKDRQATIFDAFSQADASTTRRHGGTGLGLTISRELTELMGGDLTLESEQGVGSTFTLQLPVTPCTPSESVPSPVAAAAVTMPREPLSILVADDHAVNVRLATILLTRLGHRVVVANHGKEAVAAFRAQPFDVILMDVQMPELDGLAATRQIRELEASSVRRTPIIALTANAMAGDREECLAAGMDEYLAKPLDADHLARALATLQLRSQSVSPVPPMSVRPAPAPEPPSATPKVFDRDELLARAEGDGSLLRELVSLFVATKPEAVEALARSLTANDLEQIRRDAHRIKGALLTVSATSSAHAAAQLERAAKAAELERIAPLWDELSRELGALDAALARELSLQDRSAKP